MMSGGPQASLARFGPAYRVAPRRRALVGAIVLGTVCLGCGSTATHRGDTSAGGRAANVGSGSGELGGSAGTTAGNSGSAGSLVGGVARIGAGGGVSSSGANHSAGASPARPGGTLRRGVTDTTIFLRFPNNHHAPTVRHAPERPAWIRKARSW